MWLLMLNCRLPFPLWMNIIELPRGSITGFRRSITRIKSNEHYQINSAEMVWSFWLLMRCNGMQTNGKKDSLLNMVSSMIFSLFKIKYNLFALIYSFCHFADVFRYLDLSMVVIVINEGNGFCLSVSYFSLHLKEISVYLKWILNEKKY